MASTPNAIRIAIHIAIHMGWQFLTIRAYRYKLDHMAAPSSLLDRMLIVS